MANYNSIFHPVIEDDQEKLSISAKEIEKLDNSKSINQAAAAAQAKANNLKKMPGVTSGTINKTIAPSTPPSKLSPRVGDTGPTGSEGLSPRGPGGDKIITPRTVDQNLPNQNLPNPRVEFKTNHGVFEIELFMNDLPITCSNFIDLCKKGFYNNQCFHRVVADFMIQTGCPYSKALNQSSSSSSTSPQSSDPTVLSKKELRAKLGTGCPPPNTVFSNYRDNKQKMKRVNGFIPDELKGRRSNDIGTVAMANLGSSNTGGSQWFINVNRNDFLDYFRTGKNNNASTSSDTSDSAKHIVFGKVVKGYSNVVIPISEVETCSLGGGSGSGKSGNNKQASMTASGQMLEDVPVNPVVILGVKVIDQ